MDLMVRFFREELLGWGATNLRSFPWRETKDPYAILVAETLLQQTDAPRMISVYESILSQYPTIETLASASNEELIEIIRPIGFHFRAKRLVAAAQKIHFFYSGKVPSREEELLELPGVGPYIARSICANAFDQPLAVLDTNIVRITQRFFGFRSQIARPRRDPALWDYAKKIAPDCDVGRWNLILIDFGSALCKQKNPQCKICPVAQNCSYYLNLTAKAAQKKQPKGS